MMPAAHPILRHEGSSIRYTTSDKLLDRMRLYCNRQFARVVRRHCCHERDHGSNLIQSHRRTVTDRQAHRLCCRCWQRRRWHGKPRRGRGPYGLRVSRCSGEGDGTLLQFLSLAFVEKAPLLVCQHLVFLGRDFAIAEHAQGAVGIIVQVTPLPAITFGIRRRLLRA